MSVFFRNNFSVVGLPFARGRVFGGGYSAAIRQGDVDLVAVRRYGYSDRFVPFFDVADDGFRRGVDGSNLQRISRCFFLGISASDRNRDGFLIVFHLQTCTVFRIGRYAIVCKVGKRNFLLVAVNVGQGDDEATQVEFVPFFVCQIFRLRSYGYLFNLVFVKGQFVILRRDGGCFRKGAG